MDAIRVSSIPVIGRGDLSALCKSSLTSHGQHRDLCSGSESDTIGFRVHTIHPHSSIYDIGTCTFFGQLYALLIGTIGIPLELLQSPSRPVHTALNPVPRTPHITSSQSPFNMDLGSRRASLKRPVSGDSGVPFWRARPSATSNQNAAASCVRQVSKHWCGKMVARSEIRGFTNLWTKHQETTRRQKRGFCLLRGQSGPLCWTNLPGTGSQSSCG